MAATRRPTSPAPPASPERRARRRWRWGAVIALVLGLHALVLLGLVRMPVPALPDMPDAPTLQAILLPPPPPPSIAQPQPQPEPQPLPRPRAALPSPPAAFKPSTKPSTKAAPEPAPTPASPAPAPPLATAAGGQTTAATGGGADGNATGGPGAAGAGAAEGAAAASGPSAAPPAPAYAAPASATLQYSSFVNGVQNPDGLIRWEQDGGHYRLAVETRVLWFRFAFQSTGALSARGLAPERYEENWRGRVRATRIDRAAGVVAFESRDNEVPLPPDIQDRFSVFLQIVGWVRGDPSRYATPGVTETFHLADTSDVEAIQVQYVGEDDVDIGDGQFLARAKHFVRLPRRAGDKRRVEIWLAPSIGWMPARLRQTEPDGTQIDLVYRGGSHEATAR
ncbi:DUF3108 domain-containing protein [Cupriavidus plantarum]|uniref:DUF3108 domain-containing protein n=1 Tax=Cupriavidus plantarum TaxID=942865 RepID=UPI0018506319|nr:DUF3108 domain-containing protein [Cupriavidus plantarum]NYH97564.1 hypothetical protein [Cupriavidus plantarum]